MPHVHGDDPCNIHSSVSPLSHNQLHSQQCTMHLNTVKHTCMAGSLVLVWQILGISSKRQCHNAFVCQALCLYVCAYVLSPLPFPPCPAQRRSLLSSHSRWVIRKELFVCSEHTSQALCHTYVHTYIYTYMCLSCSVFI